MMKKILCIMLTCLMLCSVFSVSSTALTDGGVGYTDTALDWYGTTYAPFDDYMKLEGIQPSNNTYTLDGVDGEFFSIRVVASHKKLSEYKQFGYDVVFTYVEGGETKTKKVSCTGDTVYKSINATVKGEVITLDAEEDFGAEYISAVVIYNIPKDVLMLQVSAMPRVTFMDSRGTMNGAIKSTTELDDRKEALQLSTMTFNIYGMPYDANDTKDVAHLERIKTVIKENLPDVIGFQELVNLDGSEWLDRLMEDSVISQTYGYITGDHTAETGEKSTIFYNKAKFELMEQNGYYLYCEHGIECTSTECKGISEVGNFSDNLPYTRLFTYARLKRLSDDKELIYINTHLETRLKTADYQDSLESKYLEKSVQNKEIDYIINFAKDWIDDGYSVILTGDFNANLESVVAQKIFAAGYKNASQESKNVVGEEPPSTPYASDPKKTMCRGIDQIFIHSENCYFVTYEYCDQKIAVGGVEDYPSDHIPRIATYVIW